MAPRILSRTRPGRPRRRLRDLLTPRWVTLLLVLGLVLFQMLVAVTAPRWARFLQSPVPVSATDDEADVPSPTPSPPAEAAERRINVRLFFGSADAPGLVLEERAVPYRNDLAEQLRHVVEELVRGSQTGLLPVVPPETRVLDVVVTPGGDALVDLSGDVVPPQGTGSQEEMMTVYSIVNTLTTNFPAVHRVQILVDDHAIETLGGHTNLTRPLHADMTLLADVPLLPVPQDEPTEGASPEPELSTEPQAPPAP
jgi:germination protein M